jgi:hypothetical protein
MSHPARRPVLPWRRPLVPILIVLLLSLWGGRGVPVAGQDVAAGAFSRMGFGAKGVAVGNALVAAPSPDVSPYYNPALLPATSEQRVAASAALLSSTAA